MDIHSNNNIAGVTAKKLRAFFKRTGAHFTLSHASSMLNWSQDRTQELLTSLAELGYVFAQDKSYLVTEKGSNLAKARFTSQFDRTIADNLLSFVVSSAEVINEIPEFTHYVAELHVVGSYLTDAPFLKHLDIVACLVPLADDRTAARHGAVASQAQRSCSERKICGEAELLNILKAGYANLRIFDKSYLKSGVESRLVFSINPT